MCIALKVVIVVKLAKVIKFSRGVKLARAVKLLSLGLNCKLRVEPTFGWCNLC